MLLIKKKKTVIRKIYQIIIITHDSGFTYRRNYFDKVIVKSVVKSVIDNQIKLSDFILEDKKYCIFLLPLPQIITE